MKGRSLLSLLLCLVLLVSLALPVLAEDEKSPLEEGIQLTEEENTDKDDTKQDDTNQDDTDKDNTDKEEPPKEEPPKEDPPKETTAPTEAPHEHVWEIVETIAKATCEKDGSNKVKCKICGTEQTHTVPKLPHTYDNACDPDCNVCYAMRDASHKPGAVWQKNSSGHWHICSVCGEKVDMGDHYPGPAATEDKDQICLTCGYVMTKALGHVHKYQSEYTSDASGHWHACEGCGDRKDFAAHEFENPCEPVCKVCGYVSENAHSYGDAFQYDEEYHWNVCAICGMEGDHLAHVPGEPATEDTPQICTVCGKELEPPLNHVHEGAEWTYDEENHQSLCSCGMVMEEGPHTWDAGTENEDGTVTFTCTKCAYQKVEGEPKAAQGEFPWVLVIGGVALVCAVGAAVALVVVLTKKPSGKFSK